MSLEVARETQLGRLPRFSLGRSCLLTLHAAGGLRHEADLSRLPPSVLASRCDAYPLRSAWVATREHLLAPHLGAAGCSRPELVEEPSRCQHGRDLGW